MDILALLHALEEFQFSLLERELQDDDIILLGAIDLVSERLKTIEQATAPSSTVH
mgnify:CR=1 FL=1